MFSFLTATRNLVIQTPIPVSSTSVPNSYVQALHNHTALLSLLPTLSSIIPTAVPASLLTSVTSPRPPSSAIVPIHAGAECFEITEQLPLGRKFNMVAAFHDIDDGTGCVLVAPGIRVDSWTKIVRHTEGKEDGQWEISEQVE